MGVTNINLYTLDGKYDDIINLESVKTKKKAVIEKNKAVISDKLSTMKKLKIGDKIKFTDIDEKEYEFEISDIVENYVANYVYIDKATYEEHIGKYKTNSVLITFDESKYEEEVTSELMKNHHVMSIIKRDQTMSNVTNMLKSLDYIVLVLLALSGALSFVVLYNLSYINISERKREIATLKVLGFYNVEVDNYIIKENFIITVIGIFIGMIFSKPFVNYVVDAIEMDLVKFIHNIDILSYLYTFGFMILFTIIVSIIIHHALRKIDMIESLKSIE
jgi:putative ABC transport system permease protein